MKIKNILIITSILLFTKLTIAQQAMSIGSSLSETEIKSITLSNKTKREIIGLLIKRIEENYILKDKVPEIVSKIDKTSKSSTYKNINDAYTFLTTLTSDLRKITNDAHFNIWYNPQMFSMMQQVMASAPQRTSNTGQGQMRRGPNGWPDSKQKNYFFKEIEILEGNIGYIKLDKIPLIDNAKSTIDATFGFLANTDAIIIDLRDNPGGFPGFISYFMSYLFPDGEKMLLFSRETGTQDQPSHFYTEEILPNPRLDKIPVYVLINENTGSAATNMSYNLQKHDRAKIVGITTEKGIMGAHAAMPFPLKSNFMVTVPIGRVINSKTKTNWNHTGVVPDIETKENAKKIAHMTAMKTLNYQPKKTKPKKMMKQGSANAQNIKTSSNEPKMRQRPSNSQGASNNTNSDQKVLLNKMEGEYTIHARMRRDPNGEFRPMEGKATFEKLYGETQIKESFQFGERFKGQAFINYASAHNRYELYQIDMMSSRRSTVSLVGKYNDSDERLNFRQIDNHPQWGQSPSLDLRWEYVFYEDGSFKKEMYSKDESGNYYLQSDYHYEKN